MRALLHMLSGSESVESKAYGEVQNNSFIGPGLCGLFGH